MVGLANRYGEKEELTRDRKGLPLFREARLWVKRNARPRARNSRTGRLPRKAEAFTRAGPKTFSAAHGR